MSVVAGSLQAAQHFVAVHAGHHDVQQDEVGHFGARHLERGGAAVGRHHVVPVLEKRIHEEQVVRCVVHDQDAVLVLCGHARMKSPGA